MAGKRGGATLIDLDGVTLNLRDEGDGPAVVLLHGWPDTHGLWRYQFPALVGAGYRAVAPDLRGCGGSSRPPGVGSYAGRLVVGDVIGLLDRLEIERAHLVGHDWGAAFAWVTAARFPNRVVTLTALSVGHPASFATAGWAQREKSWYMLLFQFEGIAEQWLSADGFRNFRELFAHPEADEVAERLSDPAALTSSLNFYRANVPPASWVRPRSALPPPVSAPTMGIWSDGERFVTEKSMTGSAAHVLGPWRMSGSTAPVIGCNSTGRTP
ncbi:MAG: alpha/beta hydrolase [Egibacteraceae bacterium]